MNASYQGMRRTSLQSSGLTDRANVFDNSIDITSRRHSSFNQSDVRTESSGLGLSRTLGLKKLVNGVLRIVNRKREQAGLKPLSLNSKLTKAAQAHTKDMAVNDFFSHTGSNGSSLGDRLQRVGYSYSYAAENIAAGSSTPKGVMKQWMNSPGHRANILSPNVTQIGIGYYYQPNDGGTTPYGYYWTQDFGKPWQ